MDTTITRRTERLADALRRLARGDSKGRIANLLARLRPGDVAFLFRSFTPAESRYIFSILSADFPQQAGEVLSDLDAAQRMMLLEDMQPEEIGGILQQASVDDAVSIVESLPEEQREPVLALVDLRRDLDEVQTQLAYEDDTAGRIMDPEFFALPEATTVRQATETIRRQDDLGMILYLYVVDEEGQLVGVTSLRQLLLASPERLLGELAQRDLIQVHTSTDQEEVAELAARYDLLAIPVTDEDRQLVGIVTVDDIVDVVTDEATEDFYKMVGTSDNELLYESRSARVAGIRLPWLLVNLVGLLATGYLLERFQSRFDKALYLLFFVPVIMGMGGNSGAQTSTITVRGLATGRIAAAQGRVWRYLFQQTKVGLLIGVALGVVVFLIAFFKEGNPTYAAVVAVALLFAVTLAALAGASIPILFQRLGIDPAIAAGPLVTTSSDILGILVYFALAGLMFQYLVP